MCLLSLHFELVVSSLSVHKIHQQTASWLHPQLSCLPWNSASCKKSKKHFTFSHCPSPIYFVKASLFFLHFFFSKVSVYILLYVAYKCGMTWTSQNLIQINYTYTPFIIYFCLLGAWTMYWLHASTCKYQTTETVCFGWRGPMCALLLPSNVVYRLYGQMVCQSTRSAPAWGVVSKYLALSNL